MRNSSVQHEPSSLKSPLSYLSQPGKSLTEACSPQSAQVSGFINLNPYFMNIRGSRGGKPQEKLMG